MASLTVDGRVIEAPEGAPLVEVLKRNGFYTSNLCYIDGLQPYAGCRTCLVDIQGPPGLQLSCTARVQDGMVVTTASEEVKEARKAVLAIILANHSDRCLTCHRREHCHPGDICLRDDVVTHRCLTCSKNYRCELQATCEMVGMSGYEPWVGEERSFYQNPQPPADRANPFMEFDPQMCIICTRCQRACEEKRHTSAITLGGRGWDTQISFGAGGAIHESNCDFSGACIDVCPTAALMEHPNKWVAKPDNWTATTCDSCAIGCTIRLGSKDGRGVIVRPGDGNPVSSDQICVRGRYHYDSLKPRERLSRHLVRRGAIQAPATFGDAVAEAARALKEAKAKGKVGVFVGATATNEEAFLAARIAREAFGATADSSVGPVARAVKTALEARIGTWKAAGDMTRIKSAKAIFLVADDLEESHNVASVRIKDAVVNGGAKLIVVGPLRSELVDFATLWLRAEPGQEGLAAHMVAQAIAGEKPANDLIADAAAILQGAPREETVVVCAPNPLSPALASAMAGGATNVAVALFGEKAAENLVVLPAEVNVHGLLDQGIAVDGALDPLAGLAGLLVVRDDPTMRLPGAVEALAATGTVVVIDNVLHETARRASVVLAEGRAYASSGTYTQGDFRIQRLTPAVRPEGETVTCFAALRSLGEALGVSLPADPDAALGEIARANPAYRPAWDLLVGQGVRQELPPATRGIAVPVAAVAATGQGLKVIAARDLYTAADAAALRHPEAEKLHRYDRIQVSEEDAARLGIVNGDEVEIAAGSRTIRAKASVTERVPAGAVFVSTLLQGGAVAAMLTDGALPAVELRKAPVLASAAG
jgi:predicted molibdopterin-dependent oxidoreductase YjgC